VSFTCHLYALTARVAIARYVEAEQLFDMNIDPQAKQRLMSGTVNAIHCQACGYQGMLTTPIVYHDPEKELLLTYFPSEWGLPVNEQEKLVGPLINQVMNKLPVEKRKAYLLRPQAMLTFQTMIEKILEGDASRMKCWKTSRNALTFFNAYSPPRCRRSQRNYQTGRSADR
jgi:hypothetical protein